MSPLPSLRGRLSRRFAIQSMVGLGLVCGAVYLVISLTLSNRQDETLEKKRITLQRLLVEAGQGHDLPAVRHLLGDFLAGHDDLAIILRRADQSLVFERNGDDKLHQLGKRLRFDVQLPPVLGGAGSAELIYDTRQDEALLTRLGWTLLTAAILGSFAVSAMGFVLVKKGLAPLDALARQTANLSPRHLEHRLDPDGQPQEVQPLVQQFNELLDRLQVAYVQMEAFNVNVAHELNNPLSILIGTCEVALRRERTVDELQDVLSSNLEELRRMAGIVGDMLFLSNAERGVTARRSEPLSLADLAAEVIEYYEALLEESELRVEIRGDARLAVDAGLVRRAVSNLLGNAVRYATRGTLIEIRIGRTEQNSVYVGVFNVGPTIDPESLPRLFDRFYRADEARTNADKNHGLGLAIVAAIAKMHNGSAEAKSLETGPFIWFTLNDGSPSEVR